MTEPLNVDELDMVARGWLLAAITAYRDRTGCTLQEAKRAVDDGAPLAAGTTPNRACPADTDERDLMARATRIAREAADMANEAIRVRDQHAAQLDQARAGAADLAAQVLALRAEVESLRRERAAVDSFKLKERPGQAVWNAVRAILPHDLTDDFRGSRNIDPFNHDENIPEFVDRVRLRVKARLL